MARTTRKLQGLPTETLWEIGGYLDIPAAYKFSMTCKLVKSVVETVLEQALAQLPTEITDYCADDYFAEADMKTTLLKKDFASCIIQLGSIARLINLMQNHDFEILGRSVMLSKIGGCYLGG